ncbi:unnamed protein product [Cutaneotrichosporon oleaginosum]
MPAIPRPASILTGITLDVDAWQSSASVAHPWWSGDEYSAAASTNAVDLGLAPQSAGAISINPAFVRRRSLWTRVVRALSIPKAAKRRSSMWSTSSTASSSSTRSQAAAYAARTCPYASCSHAVCNAR